MAIGNLEDVTLKYKQNIYNINLDVSGWDKLGVHLVPPLAAPIYVYGSNDGGALQSVRDGNATLATNFSAIQVTALGTGTAANSMATAGVYTIPVNTNYIRLAGGGADVYGLLIFESKI